MVQGYYFTGDGCRRDEDGFYWITGRVDDVINVSGHRIGTAEVESALSLHPHCAEAAVVGSAIFFFIVHLHCLLLPVVFSLLLLPTLWVSILTEADVVVPAIFFFIVHPAAMSSSSCCIAFLPLLLLAPILQAGTQGCMSPTLGKDICSMNVSSLERPATATSSQDHSCLLCM